MATLNKSLALVDKMVEKLSHPSELSAQDSKAPRVMFRGLKEAIKQLREDLKDANDKEKANFIQLFSMTALRILAIGDPSNQTIDKMIASLKYER